MKILFSIMILLFINTTVHAYTEQDVINAVIGEAEGEPQQGKEAVACAIHYRGNLSGVYGLKAYRVIHHKYSHKTYVQAKRAMNVAEDKEYCEGLINGAQYWEGTAFPTPSWARNMTLTAVIGNQKFYRDNY